MPIRAVIFDYGGVIQRTEDRTPRRELAERLGMSSDELSRVVFDNETARLATVGQMTARSHWVAVGQALKLEPAEVENLKAGFWGGDRLDSELVDYVRSLRGLYRTALLSNAWDDLRGRLVRWKILDAFDEIIISAEVGLAKPDPRIFALAVDQLAVLPEEAVFVDDFIENVRSAQAAGLQAIQYISSAQMRAELERLLKDG